MFWVDETVDEILRRDDEKYLVTDYKTPSGKIHVGALRGVIIHDILYRGILENKKNAEYWYGFDDFDPMDGLSEDLKDKFKQYMGMPLCNIPSPEPSAKNFADYFAQDFIKIFSPLGVKAKIVWASELYKSGAYNKAINIILDNAQRIREIYKEVSGGEKPADWYPLQVICPNCGKIGTTHVSGWDGQVVEFECMENMVTWAKGCGHKGKISPFDGNAKLPYKVEIVAKWFSFGTSVELAGKDHYTKGGTFDIAKKIAEEIFKIKPAFGFGYEWFLIGGKKMSSSKGIGSTAQDIASLLPAEILRFLMVRTRAKRVIEFDVEGDTVPLLYDEYDRCLDEFLKDASADLARAYYYSEVDIAEDQSSYRLRFSKVANFLQMPRMDVFAYAREEKGADLTEVEKREIENRVEVAKKWLENYAPDAVKFTIQETLPEEAKNLGDEQKGFLHKIADIVLTQEKWTGEELHAKIHEIKNDSGIGPRDAFSAIYLTFLGKDSGPQAGWLLASLDKEFVINRLKEV
jgi:lysyl-tRNA synthetase class 1